MRHKRERCSYAHTYAGAHLLLLVCADLHARLDDIHGAQRSVRDAAADGSRQRCLEVVLGGEGALRMGGDGRHGLGSSRHGERKEKGQRQATLKHNAHKSKNTIRKACETNSRAVTPAQEAMTHSHAQRPLSKRLRLPCIVCRHAATFRPTVPTYAPPSRASARSALSPCAAARSER